MKLLICTQKIDYTDPVLGFFHRWVEEFAKHCEHVHVICLYEGAHNLPPNVHVHSLGKERGVSRLKYIYRLYTYTWRLRREYDNVFVHMNSEYLVAAGWLWLVLRKPMFLWYVHRATGLFMRIGSFFATRVFSASPQSFRLKTNKVRFLGHGIDTAAFATNAYHYDPQKRLRIISVGRITPIKRLEILIEAARILKDTWSRDFEIVFIGAPQRPSDEAYLAQLREHIASYKLEQDVTFVGAITPQDMPHEYEQADVSVNMAPDGGVDKVVIESMAAGRLTVASNRAYHDYFGDAASKLLFTDNDVSDLVQVLTALVTDPASEKTAAYLKARSKLYDVSVMCRNIISEISAASGR